MNEDQEKAYVALLNNQNVFLTGKAGTGKSFTINIIYERFIKSKKNICITASTAIAAQMYSDASTVHSFAGLGYRLESVETILKNMTDVVIERLKNVQILVIDEISMLPVHIQKTLNLILKNIKKSHRLFGGCVLLVAGDFYQLTPVGEETLLFEDPFWKECEFVNVELVKNFRQNKDLTFQTHLNNVREGIFCESTLAFFRKRLEPADKHLDPSYTSKIKTFNNFKINEKWPFKTPQNVTLKKGVPVICVRNISELGIVNGTQGVVKSVNLERVVIMVDEQRIVITPQTEMLYDCKRNVITECKGMPLVLAYALTIDKVQGLTLSNNRKIEKYRVRGKGEILYRNEHGYVWYEDEYDWRKYEDDYYSAWYRKELQKKF
ncbi:ATP-dependent DNA helicase pif1-like [Hydra vulgaris]|uniref:ATP-dependent DNA helicase pif1-like n=1 Tax=Hydra vulgaris TaxID=6087 RepID=UPI0032EA0763